MPTRRQRPFKQVDVFTATPYYGNPLAVVLDGTGLSTEEMAHFAQWTNLSETTFVLPPSAAAQAAGADYRVRIFTPGGELPFAGHPTLGSCHAWLQAGGKPQASGQVSQIIQECQLGLIHIRRDGARLAFAAPPLERSAPSPAVLAQVAGALGLRASQIMAAQLLDNGPVWLGLLLDCQQTVLQLAPNHLELKNLGLKVGVASARNASTATGLIAKSNQEAKAFGARAGRSPAGVSDSGDGTSNASKTADNAGQSSTPALEVRAFAAPMGVNEDPVTGSLNASLAQWLIAEGHLPERYIAAQGARLGRAGRVHIERDAQGQVWVGGDSVTCVDGIVAL